ncbi:outer membrane beta-barrel protein [Rhodonellum sp.]|uniref:outer membrane beta-barrel protein n=1 Tax=Rhodonellum sp. TaxID=2231180 RepID=UPI00271F5A0B|nr:outer membrane beta-barrel protein [Rhodonellum sp.]MDO9554430.1 TonB-dependent receptor [Rhodonellum sp.]
MFILKRLLIFLFMVPGVLVAQTKLTGKIIDKSSQETLPGAYVFVKNAADETLENTFTNMNGEFTINKPKSASFVLEISFIGFETFKKTIETPDAGISLGVFELEQEGKLLDAFELKAQILTGEVKGDTISFNADAFKTRPQANAEELVRKMPGVVMMGGTIEVQGETVGRVLVDGEPFFGDNPAMAMQNLPVEIIDRIEFLDQKSDQAILTGFDDGQTIKTINIITKKEKRGGKFGRMYGGYGTNNNYLVGGNVNYFKGARRVTVLGLTNNVNQQNFSSDDLTGAFGSGGEQSGGGGRGGNPLMTRERPGITVTNALGINFTDKYDDGKAKLTGSYFFNNSRNNLTRSSSRTYILPSDSLQLYNQVSSSENINQSHRLDFRLDYDISEKHAIIVRPRVRFSKRETVNTLSAQNLFDQNTPINETQNSTKSNNEGFRFDNDFTYRYKFDKPGRILSTGIRTRINQNDNTSNLISTNRDFQTNNLDSLIQNSISKSNGLNYQIEIEYTEPLSEFSQLRFQYELGNDLGKNKQEVFQRELESTQFRIDSTLSNQFENTYLQHQLGMAYRYNTDKIRIYTSLDYEISNLNSDRLFPGFENTQRTFKNFIPRFVFNYDWSEKTNVRVDYRASTDAPSVRQLQEVIDNSNPIQVSTGNPNLVQEYGHRLFTRIRKVDPESSRSMFMFVSGSVRNNYLGNSTFIAQSDTLLQGGVLLRQGGQFNRPVNLDNYWDARSYFGMGFPLSFIKSNLNINARANISNRPGLINDQVNINRNIGIGQGFGLSSNISENLDFNISTNGNYNIVRSSLQENLDNNYYSQNSRLDLYWQFAGGFFFSTNVNNQFYRGLGGDFDQSIWLMNADVGYRFPKQQKLELKLTVFDLLNQNTSIERNVTDVYIQDERTQVLQQFFMLSLTYNLRSFGGSNGSEM